MAFEISEKLGLPSSILQTAKSRYTPDSLPIEDLLKDIYQEKDFLEKEKEQIVATSEQVELLKKDLEEQTKQLQDTKKEYLQKAKQEARQLLIDSKKDVNSLIAQIEKARAGKELNRIRNELHTKISQTSTKSENSSFAAATNPLSMEEITSGMEVHIPHLAQNAIVLVRPNKTGKVRIQFGNIKTTVDISQIEKARNNLSKNPELKNTSSLDIKSVPFEMNVIGQNVEQACMIIDKYLDTASISGLASIRIIHGKGTGKLRQGVHQFLKSHPHVKGYRIGAYGEGDMGATIVELK